jgi:hypothetical protein
MIASSSPERKPIEMTFNSPEPTTSLERDHLAGRGFDGAVHPEQPRHRVPPDIGVEQADDQPPPGQGDGEIHADRRLADPTLARRDREHPRRDRDVGRDGSVLSLEPCPRHQCRALGGVHHASAHLDVLDTRQGSHVALDIGTELIAKRAGGDGEGDLYPHAPTVDLDSAHHPQLDDVRAELRIDDAGQCRPDVLGRGRDDAGGCDGSDGRMARRAHGMIETTGAVSGSPR